MIRTGCIGLPSAALPPLGIEGVAVWPVTGSSGSAGSLIAPLRRHLAWYVALHRMPRVETLIACNPPSWASKQLRSACARLTVVSDEHATLRELAVVA